MTVTYPPDFSRSRWSLRRASRDPLAFLDSLAHAADDVVAFSLAGRPAFLLKHPDLIEAVLITHHHKFTKSRGLQRATRLLGAGLLTAEGDRHRRQRAAILPAFHRQRLEGYAQIMVAAAMRTCSRWDEGATIDIVRETSALTLTVVGQALFGDELQSRSDDIRNAVRSASNALDPLISLLAPARRVRLERDRLLALVDELIARRAAAAGADDLVSLLMAGAADTPMDLDQIRDDALTILLAGHETIANALIWTWILLAEHPQIEAQLAAEVDTVVGRRPAAAGDLPALVVTKSILAEALRVRPPAWIIARTASVDLDLGGARIPQGATVLISQYLLHRDPRFYDRPGEFRPDRWRGPGQERPKMAYIPFGAGPRACVGEGFAWTEGILLLATIAQQWRLRPVAPDAARMQPQPKITLRPPSELRVVVERRAARQ